MIPAPCDPAAPPSPARRAALSAFTDALFDLYDDDRAAWPHPDAWPWDTLHLPD